MKVWNLGAGAGLGLAFLPPRFGAGLSAADPRAFLAGLDSGGVTAPLELFRAGAGLLLVFPFPLGIFTRIKSDKVNLVSK